MDKVINLSYVITTRNRLPFLSITLGKLLEQLQPDEEIVVVDAQSTDGTQQYLEQLFAQGKIHQYLSEPDRNQAHGWNKAMLMAKGTLIKKIIDDDVFCYDAIRKCKAYMLHHTDVDVVISNDASSTLNDSSNINKNTRQPQFEKWRRGLSRSFTFSDVNMLVRRSSLSYIGLYNPAYTMMDWEYALRISYLKANIAYYTGYNALSVGHAETVTSLVNREKIAAEGERAQVFYEYAGDRSDISYWSKIKIAVGNVVYKQRLAEKLSKPHDGDIAAIYEHYYNSLQSLNNQEGFTFIN